jgi:hypothetical protein
MLSLLMTDRRIAKTHEKLRVFPRRTKLLEERCYDALGFNKEGKEATLMMLHVLEGCFII